MIGDAGQMIKNEAHNPMAQSGRATSVATWDGKKLHFGGILEDETEQPSFPTTANSVL